METTMNSRRVAEVFPPGEFILEELEARGWTQVDLAEIIGRDTVQINQSYRASKLSLLILLSSLPKSLAQRQSFG